MSPERLNFADVVDLFVATEATFPIVYGPLGLATDTPIDCSDVVPTITVE